MRNFTNFIWCIASPPLPKPAQETITCGLAGAPGKTRNGTRVQRVEVQQFSAKIQLRRVLSLGGNRCEQD